MVWAAVLYSGSASLVSYWVGSSLIDRNEQRYAREADLRFSLVRVNEHIDAVALAAGEADEARRIEVDLSAVLKATARLVAGLTNLTWITSSYGWITLVAPILVAAPLYFQGNLTFGGLMLASGAFLQVQSSLRWFVDNFSTIADWRATLLRVAVFRRAVIESDVMHDSRSRITYASGNSTDFEIDDLHIAAPAGCCMLKETKAKIRAGERVLIAAETGTAKTVLFRALAGLWPWGSGSVTRPAAAEILYMPRIPYMSPGTLREILAYPSAAERFDSKAVAAALTRVGMQRLVPAIETALAGWETRISTGRLNAWLNGLIAATPPPVRGGRQPKVLFATQAGIRPPHVVLFTTRFLEASYRRFVERKLREEFGFDGSPLKVSMRIREKRGRNAGSRGPSASRH